MSNLIGTLNKFGSLVYSEPNARNNPVVELHGGFLGTDQNGGDQVVAPFVAFVKFQGKGVKPVKITATVAEIDRLISELESAKADAPEMTYEAIQARTTESGDSE